jgi:hypothetical protein
MTATYDAKAEIWVVSNGVLTVRGKNKTPPRKPSVSACFATTNSRDSFAILIQRNSFDRPSPSRSPRPPATVAQGDGG